MTDNASNRPQVKKLVGIFAAVVFGIYVLFSVAHKTPASGTTGGVPEGQAWDNCKTAVRAHLRHADSADFKLLSTDLNHEANGAWTIVGTVKAVNDFNAPQEISYSCRVSPAGATTARVSPG